jgi:hypothetical protein
VNEARADKHNRNKLAPAGHWVWPGQFRRKWLISRLLTEKKYELGLTTKSQRHKDGTELRSAPKSFGDDLTGRAN